MRLGAVALVLALMLVGSLGVWRRDAPSEHLERIPPQPLENPVHRSSGDFLARQIDRLAAAAPVREEAETAVQPHESDPEEAAEEQKARTVSAPPGRLVHPLPVDEVESPSTPDEAHLQRKASEFAYVEFKGVVGGRSIGVFCVDPVTQAFEIVGEGGVLHDLTVKEVHADHVILGYGTAPTLRKPRVDLDVEYKPMDRLTPAEVELRSLRYNELYGNRMRQARTAHLRESGGEVYRRPPPNEEAEARRVYRETYGKFFRSVQSGEVQADNREYPLEAPTLDESVGAYLETFWPDRAD